MAQSILVGGLPDLSPPQGMAETPVGPSDSSDSASDAKNDGSLDNDRAESIRGDGLMEPPDEAERSEDEEADPVGKQEAERISETPAAFDDA